MRCYNYVTCDIITTIMKAVQINKYGGPEVLEIKDVPAPSPNEDQILIETYAASINPYDVKLVSGMYKETTTLKFPYTPGGDLSGKEVKSGEEFFGSGQQLAGNSGAFAEFVAVKEERIALKPKNISFEEAAALPLVGSSAIQALEDHIKLRKGQKILIHGGAGGIGHVAIQIAKAIGAFVATTVSTNDIEFAKKLGADEVIDYKQQKFEEIVKDFDAVFDTVGGDTQEKSIGVLKKGGTIVSMLGQPNPEKAEKLGVISIGQHTEINSDRLTRLAKYVEGGVVKVNVDQIFPLDQVKNAFEKQSSHPQGKLVLKFK